MFFVGAPFQARQGATRRDNMSDGFPTKGFHRLRKGRWSYSGNSYFITTSAIDKETIFTNEDIVRILFDCLQWLEADARLEVLCCVVMPNHLHMVVQLGEKQTLSRVMNSFKGFTGRRINEMRKRSGPVWQKQYYEHCIRREEDLSQIILYCYENPLRAGLVSQASEYPFWRCKFEIEPG